MKHLYGLFLTPLLLLSIITRADQICIDVSTSQETIEDIRPLPYPNQKPKIIIDSVANILSHAGAIAGDPHNRPNIGQQITGILANIINIALVAGKRDHKNRQELLHSIFDELHLDQEMRDIIEQKVEEIQRKENMQA